MSGFAYMRGGGATSGAPIHRLNKVQTLIWTGVVGKGPKRQMAANLARLYETSVRVCSDTGAHLANVGSRGEIQDLPPPHHRYLPWQYANKPAKTECPCADYLDPENDGRPWRDRNSEEHHPLCQHDRTAIAVFTDRDRIGVQDPKQVLNRPDLWELARRHYRGK